MRIVLANDHAGLRLKPHVRQVLSGLGHTVLDAGSDDEGPVDFPVVSRWACEYVLDGRADRGVLVCGTGVGAAIAANKVPGIRAAVVHDAYIARQAVEHDDVNVACLGAWVIGAKSAETCLEAYLSAEFSTDPDLRRRVAQLAAMDGSAPDSRLV